MTEQEWTDSVNPRAMLMFAARRASRRKLYRYQLACLQRRWIYLNEGERTQFALAAEAADHVVSPPLRNSVEIEGLLAVFDSPHGSFSQLDFDPLDQPAQVKLIRDVYGNPFRRVTADAIWLAWNEGTVMKLAQAIYEENAFDRMPILADALEDAGCDNVDILEHCRGPGPHVRGCWVLDLLLGKS
jgi:hypothetical protein